MDVVRIGTGTARVLETVALRALRPDRAGVRAAAHALSSVASQGRVWVGLSAAMAAHPRLRPAGRDGLAAWGVASGAAFALKAASGRQRPRLVRVIGASTSSSSMPSSHTAGAVAYATAAALQVPATGIALAPLALGVAWSRTATGRHFPTDVAVGAGLGLVAAGVVHAVARRVDPGHGGPPDDGSQEPAADLDA